MKAHRNKLDSKTKASNRTPQNFMVSIESSMKPTMHKNSSFSCSGACGPQTSAITQVSKENATDRKEAIHLPGFET